MEHTNMRYTLHTLYDDDFKDEDTNDVASALSAASIYLQDPHCICVQLYDHEWGEMVMHIWR